MYLRNRLLVERIRGVRGPLPLCRLRCWEVLILASLCWLIGTTSGSSSASGILPHMCTCNQQQRVKCHLTQLQSFMAPGMIPGLCPVPCVKMLTGKYRETISVGLTLMLYTLYASTHLLTKLSLCTDYVRNIIWVCQQISFPELVPRITPVFFKMRGKINSRTWIQPPHRYNMSYLGDLRNEIYENERIVHSINVHINMPRHRNQLSMYQMRDNSNFNFSISSTCIS